MDVPIFAQGIGRIESLLQSLERTADPAVRAAARELVSAVLALHGAGLGRMTTLLEATGAPGREVLDAYAADELVSSLLLLHDLHPASQETRVRHALERLRARGGNVELVELVGGTVRLRFPHGVDAGTRSAVEQTLYAAAPDLNGIEILASPGDPAERAGRLSLPLLGAGR